MLTKEQILAELNAERERYIQRDFNKETWHQIQLEMGALFIQAQELGNDAYDFIVNHYKYASRGGAKYHIGYRRAYDRLKKALVPLLKKYSIKKLEGADESEIKKIGENINIKLNMYYVSSHFDNEILNIILKEIDSSFSVREVGTPIMHGWIKQFN